MSPARKELKEALCRYITDTLLYIDTVRGFCEGISKWLLWRETELHMMMDIKDRADSVNLNIDHVTNSKNKGQAFCQYMKSKVTQVSADSRLAELEKELVDVLKDTLEGLEKLDCFLDAVEKLAVTSLHVFVENQVLHLREEISLEHVQVVIIAARLICPHLLKFKRDAKVFFFPRLQNEEVLSFQLDKYIQTTKKICETLEKSEFSLEMIAESVVDLDEDLSQDHIQRMLDHINQLSEIRMNQSFRTVFLFQEEPCSGFISEFNERHPRMLHFLQELEENAVQLDRMNKGAKISSVAGSSVGAFGVVLSIIGLFLIPFTTGASLALTVTGFGMGVKNEVNSLVTIATEIGVFQSFMEDVQILQYCLEEVNKRETSKIDVVLGAGKVICKAGVIGKKKDSLVDATSAGKLMKSEKLISSTGKVVVQEGKALRNIPRVASDIPDIGQAAVKGPLSLSKSARAGFIAANALFLGMDIFFICKDSISLAKGTETEVSKFIRARAKLWCSEIDTWKKIRDSLCEGLQKSEKNKAILDIPFYPEMGKKKQLKTEKEIPFDEMDEKPCVEQISGC
ncbi:Apolipoprotein L3 Apolipoprotein L-III [Channa argus]|uniref:Apolipoprotein L3 Apolipoprotein L-III n=1 Tax=Channa argus TaxID=215402 RepID=A0A6G1QB71_CHAAH|nr:Apolipoprotein L3 Apolipoprotein L-III [Channa argus]